MTTLFSLRTAVVVASTTLLFGGGLTAAGSALASSPSPPGATTGAATIVSERGIVCPRGQHAFHAPGGTVTCIPNGQLKPTPAPAPAQ
ncbi:MAG TPA: hypothetical protein VFE65_17760 [Pseudonocardia sp.]|nr:hypothetical protein [Pseudonocardia sp.]